MTFQDMEMHSKERVVSTYVDILPRLFTCDEEVD